MIKFGTDGWRAIIGEEFNLENVERVIQAYAETSPPSPLLHHVGEGWPKAGVRIYVGHDRRRLSRQAAERAAEVLAGNGFSVFLSKDFCPTPCISVMTKKGKAAGGVVITASHNPAAWNGVKFKEAYGGSASPDFTSRIEKRLEQPLEVKRTRSGISSFDPHDDYVKALRERIDLLSIRKSNWKIAYDPLFGAGAGFLEKVLGFPIREIHAENDPSFGGLNPEPIDRNLAALKRLVVSEKYDVGLATDGDADRIGAVDEAGFFITPQQIFALLLWRLIERGERGDVVKTVSTTSMIDKIAAKRGLKVHETPIGFKHICQKFLEVNPLIGGEESGGIGIPSHVYERDGLLCGLMLLEIMSAKKKRLRELLKDLEREIGPFHYLREDVHLTADDSSRLREEIPRLRIEQIGGQKVVSVNKRDGLKFVLEDGGWLLLRLSGTEPLIRIYAETASPELSLRLIAEGRRLLGLYF